MKIKIVTGFRKEQEHTIDAEEAHKAYFLFLNPDQRGVFKNGVAVRGQDIKAVEPDYNATMGWNTAHQLDEYDYLELKKNGVDKKLRDILQRAKNVAIKHPDLINLPLSDVRYLREAP